MVQLEGMDDEESEVIWEGYSFTYLMSIINLSVLLVAFAAAAFCVMLIAYTIHKTRSDDKPLEDEHSGHFDSEYLDNEYSPLNVVVI